MKGLSAIKKKWKNFGRCPKGRQSGINVVGNGMGLVQSSANKVGVYVVDVFLERSLVFGLVDTVRALVLRLLPAFVLLVVDEVPFVSVRPATGVAGVGLNLFVSLVEKRRTFQIRNMLKCKKKKHETGGF